MIAALEGKVIDAQGEDLIVNVNGVGYLVTSSSAVRSRINGPGASLKVVVYTDVKENAISLYGFDSLLEKQVFLLLKKVKGIGSRIALTIISSIGPEALLVSIGQSDVGALQRIQGVGKKTAERIIVELREKVGELVSEPQKTPLYQQVQVNSLRLPELFGRSGPGVDAVLALEKLGFSSDKASQAVKTVLAKGSIVDAGEILRQALAYI